MISVLPKRDPSTFEKNFLITDSEAIMHGVNYVGVYIRLTKNCTCFSFYNCNYPFNLTKMFDFSLSASDRVCIFSVVTR